MPDKFVLIDYPRLFLVVSVLLLWAATHLGALFGRKWRPLKDDEREDFNLIMSASLTLLGLIIGFSFSMAVSRYDQRKNYEEAEANAIGWATRLSPGNGSPVFFREHVRIEVGDPLLAFLRDSQIPECVADIGADGLPEKGRVRCA